MPAFEATIQSLLGAKPDWNHLQDIVSVFFASVL
jgi:hypothetical protein